VIPFPVDPGAHLMQTLELVELSAVVAVHGASLATSRAPLPVDAVADIWEASRKRLDQWGHSLRSAGDQTPSLVVVREILAGEVLARVWAAVATARDLHHGEREAGPMARCALTGHALLSQRALRSIETLSARSPREADRLNLLRWRCERWTDYLIGQLHPLPNAIRFAFDPRRAATLKRDAFEQADGESGDSPQVETLLAAAIQKTFGEELREPSPNGAINRRIAAGVMACFLPEMVGECLAGESRWQSRLENLADRAEGMVNQLLL
jgi:hypothetical protein